MKSYSLKLYKKWLGQATPEQIELVDAIYHECEKNYDRGGDIVVETMNPQDVLEQFVSVRDAIEYCGIKVEQALNTRWGEDTDEELKRYDDFKKWEGETQ